MVMDFKGRLNELGKNNTSFLPWVSGRITVNKGKLSRKETCKKEGQHFLKGQEPFCCLLDVYLKEVLKKEEEKERACLCERISGIL